MCYKVFYHEIDRREFAIIFSWVQHFLTQATYWHNPLKEEEYKEKSTFLSDINNEMQINETYIDQLNALDNFVMVMFNNDTMVQPISSEWFGFYKVGQAKETENLIDSKIYKEVGDTFCSCYIL